MLTTSRTLKAGTVERRIVVARDSCGILATVTDERQGKRKVSGTTTTYRLRKIESQLGGIGVEVAKLTDAADCYNVLLNGPHGHDCDCPHMTYARSNKPCRHIEAALEALSRNIL